MTYSCPYCDESFPTEAGRNQHKTKVHGPERNNTCVECGHEFHTSPSRVEKVVRCDDCRDTRLSERTKEKISNSIQELADNGEHPLQNPEIADRVASALQEYEWSDEHRNALKGWSHSEETKKLLSEKFSGEKNPQWEGGRDRYYGPNWPEQRQKAKERDNYKCQNCGTERKLDVHHIIPIKEFDEPTEGNELTNLVTLCKSCHGKAEHGKI